MTTLFLSVVFNILSFGAVGNGQTDNTAAINSAIQACAVAGGGEVVVPRGTFVTGSLYLRSNVTLRLDSGAVVRGTKHLYRYGALPLLPELKKYDSGVGTANANSATDTTWAKAMIFCVGIHDAGISGRGVIDGIHLYNPHGEEQMRGPHAIVMAHCRHMHFEGIEVRRAANYAFLAYDLSHSSFRHLTINEGWDGIHIRGCDHVEISDCEFHTGDDGIAGGYWKHMRIEGNTINSSCNGIRMIQPSVDLTIAHNRFFGPGRHPHRTSGKTNSDAAISLEPGGWGPAPGRMDKIRIIGNTVRTTLSPLSVNISDDNPTGTILVDSLTADDVTHLSLAIRCWGKARIRKVVIRNTTLCYRGNDDKDLPRFLATHGTDKWPVFPAWGLYFRNVDCVELRNVTAGHTGQDYRRAIVFDEGPQPKDSAQAEPQPAVAHGVTTCHWERLTAK